jgi:hypothetical protein
MIWLGGLALLCFVALAIEISVICEIYRETKKDRRQNQKRPSQTYNPAGLPVRLNGEPIKQRGGASSRSKKWYGSFFVACNRLVMHAFQKFSGWLRFRIGRVTLRPFTPFDGVSESHSRDTKHSKSSKQLS